MGVRRKGKDVRRDYVKRKEEKRRQEDWDRMGEKQRREREREEIDLNAT